MYKLRTKSCPLRPQLAPAASASGLCHGQRCDLVQWASAPGPVLLHSYEGRSGRKGGLVPVGRGHGVRPTAQASTGYAELAPGRASPTAATGLHLMAGTTIPERVRVCQIHKENCVGIRMTPLEASCLASRLLCPGTWPWRKVRSALGEAGPLAAADTCCGPLAGWASPSGPVPQEPCGPKSRIL